MRITTGIYKGRKIVMPQGIRPTQDKVRKALFDILGDIKGLSFLELFAGSGAVGLEAISRGAVQVVLVEAQRASLEAIEKNIASLGVKDCTVFPIAAAKAVGSLEKAKKSFDIVFLDPPYDKNRASAQKSPDEEESATKKTLQMLGACDIVTPDGLVVAQHFKNDDVPERAGKLELLRQSRYGDTVLSFYTVCKLT